MSISEFVDIADKLHESREVKGVTILFEYHDPLVHQAIRALKFKGNQIVAKLLAEVLYENIIETLAEKIQFEKFYNPVFIPMPSSNKRKQERGWNQCELVAVELAHLDIGKNFSIDTKSFIKNSYTETQVGKTRAERLHNLAGSFSVKNPDALRDRNIILFDDVVTTGATMSEAKKTLLSAGARKIWCVALAH